MTLELLRNQRDFGKNYYDKPIPLKNALKIKFLSTVTEDKAIIFFNTIVSTIFCDILNNSRA